MKTRNLFLLAALIAGLGLIAAGPVTAQSFRTLHNFTANSGPPYFTNSDGANPHAGLISDSSGNTLYGTAQGGGRSGVGTVFAVDTNGTGFTTLHSFTAIFPFAYPAGRNSDGANPIGGLVLSGNTLYGTAEFGGSSGHGTVFAINTDGTGFTTLHNFAGYPSDGAFPYGGLILTNNTLYGTTAGGGSSRAGTVFAINTDGAAFTNLHAFAALVGYPYNTNRDGLNPRGRLTLSGHTLYGVASGGGRWNGGTVFAINTDGTSFTNLHNFAGYPSDGAFPYGGLILTNNTLYGTAAGGGSSGDGTVFALNTDGTGFTNLHNFTAGSGSYPNNTNSDGATPFAGLYLSGQTLYGAAVGSGSLGHGTVFALNTDGTGFTNLHNFNYSDGAYPAGGLFLSGKTLYGTTEVGGNSGLGTVFKLFVNRAPSSVATVSPLFSISPNETNRFILSPSNAAATVVLDGSQSSDLDNDPLQFSWYSDGQPHALDISAVSTNLFVVGLHSVRLVVSDGYDTASAQVSFEVITPASAVGQLMVLVENLELGTRNKQSLLAALLVAMSAFDRGNQTAALNQLSAFQNKVRALIAPSNPALANEFTAGAQQISDVVSGRE